LLVRRTIAVDSGEDAFYFPLNNILQETVTKFTHTSDESGYMRFSSSKSRLIAAATNSGSEVGERRLGPAASADKSTWDVPAFAFSTIALADEVEVDVDLGSDVIVTSPTRVLAETWSALQALDGTGLGCFGCVPEDEEDCTSDCDSWVEVSRVGARLSVDTSAPVNLTAASVINKFVSDTSRSFGSDVGVETGTESGIGSILSAFSIVTGEDGVEVGIADGSR
jgi:hypothetical protein